MSSEGVIVLLDDDDDDPVVVAQNGDDAVEVVETIPNRRPVQVILESSTPKKVASVDDDDEVLVVEARCVQCDGTGSETRPVLSLTACKHPCHYDCCQSRSIQQPKQNATVRSPDDNPARKRRKGASSSPIVEVVPELVEAKLRCCPRCSAEVDWVDSAVGLSRKQYLEQGLVSMHPDEKPVELALLHLLTTWKSQLDGTPKGRARGAKAAPKASKAGGSGVRAVAAGAAWAGGTGYGGTATEKINTAAVEKSLQRQQKSDEDLTKAMKALTDSLAGLTRCRMSTEALLRKSLPRTKDDAKKSESMVALIPLLSSYLINGPADVAARSALYKQIFALLGQIAANPCTVAIFVSNATLPFSSDDGAAPSDDEFLLYRLNRLMESLRGMEEDPEGKEALALAGLGEKVKQDALRNVANHPHFRGSIGTIQSQVQAGRSLWRQKKAEAERIAKSDTATPEELVKAYKASMGPVHFRAISIIDLCSNAFMAHHYVRKDPNTGTMVVGGGGYATAASSRVVADPSRMGRIRKEIASLKTSMPLEWNSSIFCAVDETRPDVLQFLIVGPEGTPYQNGCFLFDCYLSNSFPSTPPHIVLQTTGGGTVRFNPNLYKDGKVCLSLLGTWSGPGWDAKNSTVLQVLVSIQSLIMVPDPYFNEPGFESSMKTPQGQLASEMYNANIRYHTIRLAMTQMMVSPPYAFQQIIKTHFTLKRKEITEQLAAWKEDLAKTNSKVASSSSSSHAMFFASGGSGGVPDVNRFRIECENAASALNRLATTGSAALPASSSNPTPAGTASSSSSSSVAMPMPPGITLPGMPFFYPNVYQPSPFPLGIGGMGSPTSYHDDDDEDDEDADEEDYMHHGGGYNWHMGEDYDEDQDYDEEGEAFGSSYF